MSAPRSRNSAASAPVSTPPIPERSAFPPLSPSIIAASAATLASATGFTAGPEYPPGVVAPSTHGCGLSVSRSTPEIELMVFIAASPRAPPASAALPASAMLVTLGVSLAQKGSLVFAATHEQTS